MNNVLNIDSFSIFDSATLDNHSQSTFRSDPTLGHIQSTMTEGMSGQIKASHTQGLALCLVDGHAQGWPQWEVPAPELERKLCVCWVGVHAGLPMLRPATISASMTREWILLSILVPLACPHAPCMFLSSMTGAPSFSVEICN